MRCTERFVDRLFEAMKAAGVWDDAIVVVHGDHGSRIVKHNPVPENAAALTVTDFRDAYSALFALRAPGVAAEEVAGLRPLQALLSQAFGIEKTFDPPKIYLRPKQGPLAVCGLENLTLQQTGTMPLCPSGARQSALAHAGADRTE
jgi:arylsulfatase A-like enzyme